MSIARSIENMNQFIHMMLNIFVELMRMKWKKVLRRSNSFYSWFVSFFGYHLTYSMGNLNYYALFATEFLYLNDALMVLFVEHGFLSTKALIAIASLHKSDLLHILAKHLQKIISFRVLLCVHRVFLLTSIENNNKCVIFVYSDRFK